MKSRLAATFALGLTAFAAAPLWAQNASPEDQNIPDQDTPTMPAANNSNNASATPTPAPVPSTTPNPTTPNSDTTNQNASSGTMAATPGDASSGDMSGTKAPEDQTLGDTDVSPSSAANTAVATPTPSTSTTQTPTSSTDMVMIPRAVWEQLQNDVAQLKAERAGATAASPTVPAEANSGESSTGNAGGEEAAPAAPRNYLALPDISLILQAKGLLSSDKRDPGRTRLNLSEGELGVQGYVYPGVKADAFIVGSPSEDQSFQFEEGYLTFLGVAKGLNINVGRKFAPFGRTGELHNHSWLYPRQLLPIQNLVSDEALVGDGVNFNYLFPTKGALFVRGSLGFFSGEGTDTRINLSNPSDPFFGGVPGGTTAGFTKRFINARLWAGDSIGENSEIEFGLSRAHGTSEITDDAANRYDGNVTLTGADVSFRHFMGGGRRLLLRSEYFLHQPDSSLPTRRASGYYALANMRLDPYKDIGLLYEESGFPQTSGHENALSLIYTKQFTEQFYGRIMATHGDRPGGSYNEIRLQFTAGLGPHTHNLE